MDRITIERLGGFAGFGLPGSRIKSRGDVALSELSPADRSAVAALFERKDHGGPGPPDAFRYRLTRQTTQGSETVEVPEHVVPEAIRNRVKDVLE